MPTTERQVFFSHRPCSALTMHPISPTTGLRSAGVENPFETKADLLSRIGQRRKTQRPGNLVLPYRTWLRSSGQSLWLNFMCEWNCTKQTQDRWVMLLCGAADIQWLNAMHMVGWHKGPMLVAAFQALDLAAWLSTCVTVCCGSSRVHLNFRWTQLSKIRL
jgi:hypothetical protein